MPAAEDKRNTIPAEVWRLPLGWESSRNNSPPYSLRDYPGARVWTRGEVEALAEFKFQKPEGSSARRLFREGDWDGQFGGYGPEYYELYTHRSTGAIVGSR